MESTLFAGVFERVRNAATEPDGRLSVVRLLGKGARYALAAAKARVQLFDCDIVGQGTRVYGGSVRVVNEGRIAIGADTIFVGTWAPVELVTGPGGSIELGPNCLVNFGVSIRAQGRIRLGANVMIGQYAILVDAGHPGDDADAKAISIGDHVWIAGRVTVLPGASIGAGSAIVAGSVVEGEIPAGVLAGGIPARVLRKLGKESPDAAAASAGRPAVPVPVPVPGPAPAPAARPAIEHRGLLLSDFTIDELARQLERDGESPGVEAQAAPFGQVAQLLLAGLDGSAHDFAVVWTRPSSTLPSFRRLLECEAASDDEVVADVDRHCELIASGARGLKAVFVPTWTLPGWERGLGMLDGRPGGASRALDLANSRLAGRLAAVGNVFVLNAQRWIDRAGPDAHSAKGWYLGKVPFSGGVFAEATADLKAALRGLTGQARKLIVLDLDDTLWAGVVGDVGWEGLRLGGHDAVGEALVDFQKQLKAITRRGVVLGIVSKNTESVALEAIDRHPEMVLKRGDFVAHRINWQDKARNVADLAASLRLGLQSVVFIDDNPAERARVREALPEVLVPEWPQDKLLYPSAFAALRCFDAPGVSREDASRTQLYAAEQERAALRTQVPDLGEWLRSLGMRVLVERLDRRNQARVAQLLNKTNQMNLSTRRLTEDELVAWAQESGRRLWCLAVADKLGDAGVTGIVSVEAQGDALRIVDFVLSCRVMGRTVEDSMIHLVVEHARTAGLRRVEAVLLPTSKNQPCRDWFEASSLQKLPDGVYAWDVSRSYPLPEAIRLDGSR